MTVSVTNWIISLTLCLFTYKMSSCTTSRDLPCNVWWVYMWQTELSPLHCDFLHIKVLLVLHLETCQAMSDDYRLENELSPLPCHFLHIKFLVLHLETCQALSNDYRWETELSPLPCYFLDIKFLLVLHLETSQAMSDYFISDKLNYLPYLVTFYI
jgi:hypothetical protein